MNYTLINQFISKYYKHYLDLYFKELNNLVKQKNKFYISLIDTRCRKVIKEYQANWIVEYK